MTHMHVYMSAPSCPSTRANRFSNPTCLMICLSSSSDTPARAKLFDKIPRAWGKCRVYVHAKLNYYVDARQMSAVVGTPFASPSTHLSLTPDPNPHLTLTPDLTHLDPLARCRRCKDTPAAASECRSTYMDWRGLFLGVRR